MGKIRDKTRMHSRERGRQITRLLARDGDTCVLCGLRLNRKVQDTRSPEYVTFDHVLPRSLGGLDILSNLRLVHQRCNLRRGATPPSDF